jgi:hypothetical protein
MSSFSPCRCLLLLLLTLRCTALNPMEPGAIAGWLAALKTLHIGVTARAVMHACQLMMVRHLLEAAWCCMPLLP